MKKTVFGVCDQVRLNPACSATETSMSWNFEFSKYTRVVPEHRDKFWAMLMMLYPAETSNRFILIEKVSKRLFHSVWSSFAWEVRECGADLSTCPGLYKIAEFLGWMDGWVRVLRPFNSISVISRRWEGEHERLCAMKRRLGSGRISPPSGFETATPWSEVGSANRSATRTLLQSFLRASLSAVKAPLFHVTSDTVQWWMIFLHIPYVRIVKNGRRHPTQRRR